MYVLECCIAFEKLSSSSMCKGGKGSPALFDSQSLVHSASWKGWLDSLFCIFFSYSLGIHKEGQEHTHIEDMWT